MPWYDRYFKKEWEHRFRREAKKQFQGSPHLIDEAFQNAWGVLFEKLKAFPRKYTTDALVFTTFQNLLKDDHRKHFGRCRPKAWVERLGSLWSKTARELCQTGLPADVIAGVVCSDHTTADENIPCQEQVENIIPVLQSKPYCSTFKASEEWTEEHQQGDPSTVDKSLSDNELKLVINTILQHDTQDTKVDEVSELFLQQMLSISTSLQESLNDDDRILLTLLYREDFSVAKAARDLNLEAHTVRYQRKQILNKIRKILEKYGINLGFLD